MTHSQEKVLKTYNLGQGASAELVQWEETLWCGKLRIAENNTDEPDIEKLMEEFVALGDAEPRAWVGRVHELQLSHIGAAQRGFLRVPGPEPQAARGL